MIQEFNTFGELLRWRADTHPDRPLFTYLTNGEIETQQVTFAALDQRARMVAAHLQAHLQPGDRALLLYAPGIDYVVGFFGCLYAGVIAVPAYPPDPARLGRTLPRLRAIAADSGAGLVLTTRPIQQMGRMLMSQAPELAAIPWVTTDTLDPALAASWQPPAESRDTIAFLQYTSGSTRTPKGVILTHGNLLHNAWRTVEMMGATPDSVMVSWLPPYHDMGLIGMLLQPVYNGHPSYLMAPVDFLKKPLRWLRAVSKYRATWTGGPNFAFDLCVRKFRPEDEPEPLDLSSLKVLFNGAEPIRPETLDRFAETFAPYGFRREALYPCYGLAEGTLMASGACVPELPATLQVDKNALGQDRVAPPESPETAVSLAGSGRSLVDQTLAIVDPDTRRSCPPDAIGEIWLKGPSVAHGYWQLPQETAETFHAYLADSGDGPFLRTGDLGFLRDGELYVTGRRKDMIIVHGQNHYPQDIELSVEQAHPALRPGCGAAFSVDAAGEERLVVVQEVYAADNLDAEAIFRQVRNAVSEAHDLQLHEVVLIRPRSIFKTSSGKIQRFACRDAFLNGGLEVVAQDSLETAAAAPEAADSLLLDMLQAVDAAQRPALLISYLRRQLAAALDVNVGRLDPNLPLSNFGIGSVQAVEFSQQLETDTGHSLPATLAYDYPTIAAIADYLLQDVLQLVPKPQPVETPPPAASPRPAAAPLPDLDTMSDEDAEAALLRELGQS
ncbi:MAG: AMP-binding protein [Anaerolineales bacterium]|nr:AMP-binding protein [Anaerolineales bacterium]